MIHCSVLTQDGRHSVSKGSRQSFPGVENHHLPEKISPLNCQRAVSTVSYLGGDPVCWNSRHPTCVSISSRNAESSGRLGGDRASKMLMASKLNLNTFRWLLNLFWENVERADAEAVASKFAFGALADSYYECAVFFSC